MKFLLVFALLIELVHSFKFVSRSKYYANTLAMSTEDIPVVPKVEKEWVGAKKFSMKDRYTTTIFSNEQIAKILPHRYPFLLVDRVVEFEPGKRAVGIKCISANEPQFTGHFPGRPIMPGVLMIEAMAQLGMKQFLILIGN